MKVKRFKDFINEGMSRFDILNKISILKRQAHEEMVTQNNKSSLERNYSKADRMYDEIRELEKQLKLMKESKKEK